MFPSLIFILSSSSFSSKLCEPLLTVFFLNYFGYQAKKLLQEQLRISRNLTQKAAESESDEEMEAPTQEPGLEDNEEESDSYGNLVTSEDNPWKLDTSGAGAGFHSLETSNNVDNGNFYLKKKQTNKKRANL